MIKQIMLHFYDILNRGVPFRALLAIFNYGSEQDFILTGFKNAFKMSNLNRFSTLNLIFK